MDDDAFNIQCQDEPAPGGWRAGDSMDGNNRKIRVHLWHDTVVVYSIGSSQEAQTRWGQSISSETNSSLWPLPYD